MFAGKIDVGMEIATYDLEHVFCFFPELVAYPSYHHLFFDGKSQTKIQLMDMISCILLTVRVSEFILFESPILSVQGMNLKMHNQAVVSNVFYFDPRLRR